VVAGFLVVNSMHSFVKPAAMAVSLGYFGAVLHLVAASPVRNGVVDLPPVNVSANIPLVKVADFQLREARAHAAAVTDGRYIYVIGGANATLIRPYMASIERFDTVTGISEEFARLHRPRISHGAVLHDGKIYVLGGMTWPNIVEDSVEVVDLATRRVFSGPTMPKAREEFGCALLGDDLYVLGGGSTFRPDPEVTRLVDIYSFASRNWRKGEPLSLPRLAAAAVLNLPLVIAANDLVASDGTRPGVGFANGPWIVVPGGFNGNALDLVQVFNPGLRAWFSLPPLLHPVSASAPVILGHYLFLFGNYTAPYEVVAYNFITRKSESYTLRYKPARSAAVVVVQGKIYVIGGKQNPDGSSSDSIQVFEPTERIRAAEHQAVSIH